ncbi:Cellulose binding domain-containing protein [Micromonospora inyonensis]|uniref:Cellulose binding domain-containing protein n=1 Tax=Micromonospora inyonensis TaxID=47866 RepID=A0A1C6S5E3_9ACTN|nr:Cellulose binding domain-containing protein [Micromonospora inyonensis]
MRQLARRRRLAMLAATTLAIGGVALPAGVAQAAPACDVVYATSDWNNGFTANVTIKNLGDPINGWTLKFTFPSGQQLLQGWSARWSQSAPR